VEETFGAIFNPQAEGRCFDAKRKEGDSAKKNVVFGGSSVGCWFILEEDEEVGQARSLNCELENKGRGMGEGRGLQKL
jgi:hypothetical protein